MENESLETIPTLPPHKYPLWVKIFALGIVIATLYSLALLPEYLVAAKKMRTAEQAYSNQDYEEAIGLYGYVLETVPSSRKAKIGAAEAIFADGDTSNDEVGLGILQDITLDKDSWARITKVMPSEYQQYFNDVKN
jgi:hypothetical protein